jgi:hypothetical protein
MENPTERLAESVAASLPQEQAQLDRLKSRRVMICTPIARVPVNRDDVEMAPALARDDPPAAEAVKL